MFATSEARSELEELRRRACGVGSCVQAAAEADLARARAVVSTSEANDSPVSSWRSRCSSVTSMAAAQSTARSLLDQLELQLEELVADSRRETGCRPSGRRPRSVPPSSGANR